MADEIVRDLKPRNNVYPAVNSDDRAHIGDETCWCQPHVTATTITHRPLVAGSDEAIVDMVRFIAENGGAVEVNGVRIENLGHYNREYDKAQFAMQEARARIAELEAAQRPPLGYEVVAKRPKRQDPNAFEYTPAGSIWPEREPVDNHRGWCQDAAAADPERYGTGMEYIVVELREVQS